MIHARRAFCWHCQLRRDSRGDTTASDSDTNGDGMQVSRSTQSATEFAGSLLVLGRYEEGERSSDEAAIDEALGGALGAAAERLYFKGKARQTVALDTIGRLPVDRVILVGLGKAEDVTPASLRDFAAMGMDDAMSGRFGTVGVIAPNRNDDTARQIALGAQLATYRFNQLQAKPEDAPHPEVESLALLNTDADESVLSAGSHMAAAVNLARTLINEPANICTPEQQPLLKTSLKRQASS